MKKILALVQLLLLVGIGFLSYLPSFKVPFQFDDYGGILRNPYIQIKNLSPHSLLQSAFQDYRQNRPLTNLSFGLNYYFGGLKPFGYHLVNFCFFLIASFAVWLLMRKILRKLGYESIRADLSAWLTALVWTVHPLNTQAVTYIIQRHTSMSSAFFLWSLYFFHLGLEKSPRKKFFYFGSGFFFLLGMMCKETTLVLPLMLLLYHYTFFSQGQPHWLRRKRKWIIALVIFYFLILLVLLRPSVQETIFDFSNFHFSAYERFLTEPKALLWYLFLIPFPFPQFQSIIYDFSISRSLFDPPTTILYFFLALGLIMLGVIWLKKHPVFSFIVFWYFGQLALEALPLALELAFDHWVYLASLSLIGGGVSVLVLSQKKLRWAISGIGLIVIIFSGFTFERNRVWQTQASLWRDAVKKAPVSGRSWFNYCDALTNEVLYLSPTQAKTSAYENNCQRAIPACLKVLSFASPETLREREAQEYLLSYALIQSNIGSCYLLLGKMKEAEEYLLSAVKLSPENLPRVSKGSMLIKEMKTASMPFYNLGTLYLMKGEYEKAREAFQSALERYPTDARAHYQLAISYLHLQKEEDYLKELESALWLDPDLGWVRKELAWAWARRGDCARALNLISEPSVSDQEFKSLWEFCKSEP